MDAIERLVYEQLSLLRSVRFRLTKPLLAMARNEMVLSGLRSHDAVVVAVARTLAEQLGIGPHLATVDRDFRRVDDLHVWGLLD
jgi:predicted nucleic acid-binding protein